MALSGSFEKAISTGYKMVLEWSATQNVANNQSTITLKSYLVSTGASYTINSSATKTSSITCNGSESASVSVALSGNQKKLIQTRTTTVNHNADGTLSIAASATIGIAVTLNGTYISSVTASGTIALNTIPRASSISSSANWYAVNNLAVTINRASSAFTHTVKCYVNGVLIKTVTGVGASTTLTFSVDENTNIFKQLAQTDNKASKLELLTYNGSTHIGTTSITGTCTAPYMSTTTHPATFNIGDSISGTITRGSSQFRHMVYLAMGNSTWKIWESTADTTSWSYATSNIASALYNIIPSATMGSGQIRIYTYFNGVLIRSYNAGKIDMYVVNSNPTFTASQIGYEDSNSTVVGITGNNQYIVQNKSTLTGKLLSLATAKNGASISSYTMTINGVSKSFTAVGSQSWGAINASSNITMVCRVTDSRGLYTEVSKTVNIVPYSNPTLNASVARVNNWEDSTTVKLSGTMSLVSVGGVNKNVITATTGVQYRQKATTATWADGETGWVNMTWSMSGGNYTATNVTLSLSNTSSFNFELRVKDKFGTYKTTKLLGVGQPIMFVDATSKNVGIGRFPRTNAGLALDVKGEIASDTSVWVSNPNNSEATVHLNFASNNVPRLRYGGNGNGSAGGFAIQGAGDKTKLYVSEAGALEFGNGGGKQSLMTPDNSGGTTFTNGGITVNGNSKFNGTLQTTSNLTVGGVLQTNNFRVGNQTVLWQGGLYMHGTQTCTPSRKLSQCMIGWVLVWSAYVNNANANNSFIFHLIPKQFPQLHSGGGAYFDIRTGTSQNGEGNKYLYIFDDKLNGHADNSNVSVNAGSVLRYVLEV